MEITHLHPVNSQMDTIFLRTKPILINSFNMYMVRHAKIKTAINP